jgi:hypothetical protein
MQPLQNYSLGWGMSWMRYISPAGFAWQALLQLELSGRAFDCSKGAGLRALGLVEGEVLLLAFVGRVCCADCCYWLKSLLQLAESPLACDFAETQLLLLLPGTSAYTCRPRAQHWISAAHQAGLKPPRAQLHRQW